MLQVWFKLQTEMCVCFCHGNQSSNILLAVALTVG
jgi:hypothetical protein